MSFGSTNKLKNETSNSVSVLDFITKDGSVIESTRYGKNIEFWHCGHSMNFCFESVKIINGEPWVLASELKCCRTTILNKEKRGDLKINRSIHGSRCKTFVSIKSIFDIENKNNTDVPSFDFLEV